MSQQEEDPSRYTRTLVVKPALSQMYDQLLPKSKSLETACKNHRTHTSAPGHVSVPRSRNFSDCVSSAQIPSSNFGRFFLFILNNQGSGRSLYIEACTLKMTVGSCQLTCSACRASSMQCWIGCKLGRDKNLCPAWMPYTCGTSVTMLVCKKKKHCPKNGF